MSVLQNGKPHSCCASIANDDPASNNIRVLLFFVKLLFFFFFFSGRERMGFEWCGSRVEGHADQQKQAASIVL
jgi:hypothetical protein